MINQFLLGVKWGELDFLLIDLPPGTGDIQLTIMQKIQLTGAILVTTPQEVAVLDVSKAKKMFDFLPPHSRPLVIFAAQNILHKLSTLAAPRVDN